MSKIESDKRNVQYDLLRSLAMIYIVAFWHIQDYTIFFSFINPATKLLTIFILGLFVFLSGLLLASRSQLSTFNEVKVFYFRLLYRIYPMYALSAIGFFLAQATDLSQLIKGLFFLNLLTGTPPPTIWFVEMIFLFYVLFPIFIIFYHPLGCIVTGVCFSFFLILIHYASGGIVHFRLGLYLIGFVFGIFVGKTHRAIFFINSPSAFLVSILLLPVIFFMQYKLSGIAALFTQQLGLLLFIPLIFMLSHSISKIVYFPLIHALSYASLATYLFHRFFLGIGNLLFSPASLLSSIVYFLLFLIPLTFILSFLIQKLYDLSFDNLYRFFLPKSIS